MKWNNNIEYDSIYDLLKPRLILVDMKNFYPDIKESIQIKKHKKLFERLISLMNMKQRIWL